MHSDEQFHSIDQKPQFTVKEAKKMSKRRAESIQKKYGLESFSHEEVLAKEGKISDAIHESVKDTESELSPVEGNIAENLIKAAESGADGDISAALSSASSYHQNSSSKVKQVLQKRKLARIQKIFQAA